MRTFFHRYRPDISATFILVVLAIGTCFAAIATMATVALNTSQ